MENGEKRSTNDGQMNKHRESEIFTICVTKVWERLGRREWDREGAWQECGETKSDIFLSSLHTLICWGQSMLSRITNTKLIDADICSMVCPCSLTLTLSLSLTCALSFCRSLYLSLSRSADPQHFADALGMCVNLWPGTFPSVWVRMSASECVCECLCECQTSK